jgi:hypothetical protein
LDWRCLDQAISRMSARTRSDILFISHLPRVERDLDFHTSCQGSLLIDGVASRRATVDDVRKAH